MFRTRTNNKRLYFTPSIVVLTVLRSTNVWQNIKKIQRPCVYNEQFPSHLFTRCKQGPTVLKKLHGLACRAVIYPALLSFILCLKNVRQEHVILILTHNCILHKSSSFNLTSIYGHLQTLHDGVFWLLVCPLGVKEFAFYD